MSYLLNFNNVWTEIKNVLAISVNLFLPSKLAYFWGSGKNYYRHCKFKMFLTIEKIKIFTC